MRHPVQSIDDRDAFLLALGQLWSAGVAVDWSPLTGSSADARPQLVTLPGYPFAHQRHWVEPNATVRAVTPIAPQPVTNGSTNGAAVHRGPGAGSSTEDTLRRIWSQCLGVKSIDRKDNFFELGGDSLIAISIATNAANEGFEIAPRDLYEHPTLAGLASAIDAQYAAGGLTKPPDETAHPAVPPTIAHFLEHGVREAGSWRIPLMLRLDPKVSADDVRAVLAALIDHHDALRLRLVERAGTWE